MSSDHDSTAAQDVTLQKIGRNVVYFQKMEAMLKFILTVTNFAAPISAAQEHLAARANSLRRKPMGDLVEAAAKGLHNQPPAVPSDAKEVWVTHSLSLSEGGSRMPDWRREMRRVVKERNALIHQMVASWDPRSLDSCRALCKELDAQRERTLPAYEHFQSIVKAIRESQLEMKLEVDDIVASFPDRRTHGA